MKVQNIKKNIICLDKKYLQNKHNNIIDLKEQIVIVIIILILYIIHLI